MSAIAELLAGYTPSLEEIRSCALCGCTDLDACQDPDTGLPCSWVDDLDEDVCSVCAKTAAAVEDSRRVEIYSPFEAQHFIETTRAARLEVRL